MLKPSKPSEYAGLETFDVPETAKILKIHPETAREYLRSGRLPGFRVGNRFRVARWVIDIATENGVPMSRQEAQSLFIREPKTQITAFSQSKKP